MEILSDSRSEKIIRAEKQKRNNFNHDINNFLVFWQNNKLEKNEIKDQGLQEYIAGTLYDCLKPQTANTSVVSQVVQIGEKLASLFLELLKFALKEVFERDKDATCQMLIGANADPRTLPDPVKAELRQAADNPEGWGITTEDFEAWGKAHGVGRVRASYAEEEIVYDDF